MNMTTTPNQTTKAEELAHDGFVAGFICANGDADEAKDQARQYVALLADADVIGMPAPAVPDWFTGAVGSICLQSGEDPAQFMEWMKNGGLVEMVISHFAPSAKTKPVPVLAITPEMKIACLAEFHVEVVRTCPVCLEDDPELDCEICNGEYAYKDQIPIPWTTCKEIFRTMLAAAPQPPAVSDDKRDVESAPSYCYSYDQERFFGRCSSEQEAVHEAFDNDPDAETVWIGEGVQHTAHEYVLPYRIVESASEQAYDEIGEAAEDWLISLGSDKEKMAELQKMVGDWLESNEPVTFYGVTKIKEFSRSAIDAMREGGAE